MKKSLLTAMGLLAISGGMMGMGSSAPHLPQGKPDRSPQGLGWGLKKRQRYNDLLEEGYDQDVAFAIVETYKGKVNLEKGALKEEFTASEAHTLYTPEDFTTEEFERDNILAILVIKQCVSICKLCGKSQKKLEGACK